MFSELEFLYYMSDMFIFFKYKFVGNKTILIMDGHNTRIA